MILPKKWRLPCEIILLLSLLGLPAPGEPVISEFMADNKSTLADEDGEYSDWIEIHNPDAEPVDMAGWKLTDSAGDLGKWIFPDITLEPGEFRIFFASQKHEQHANHTNFKLSKSGEYLALVRPDGSVRQEFAPSFPAQEADESYGLRFSHRALIEPGAAVHYLVPEGDLSGWQETAYDDAAWAQGTTGLGFGLTIPGITVRQVFKNGTLSGGLTDALHLLSLPPGDPGILREATAIYQTVNILGDAGDGRFPNNDPPPGGAGDDYALEATGFLHIPVSGTYTFGLNSDDGGAIWIDGNAVMLDDSYHSPADHFGSTHLSAGAHFFRVVMFERGGGDEVEFFAAAGSHNSWNSNFRLVGDTAHGGLAASTLPGGSAGIIATDLEAALGGRYGAYVRIPFDASDLGGATTLSLVMRHADGFAAWLNGNPALTVNAPEGAPWNAAAFTPRTVEESLTRTGWNATSLLSGLGGRGNVLAIHGMRAELENGRFLVLPELIAGSLNESAEPVFFGNGQATPGWINGDHSVSGRVADTKFSVKRGIFTAPFALEITTATPGAEIRYTLDGSTPTATHGIVYTGPVGISSTTNLRVAAFLDGWEPTNVDTQSYLFPADVIRQQPSGTAPPGWPSSSGTAQVLNYGMDPRIVDHADPNLGGPAQVEAALRAIPSVVLTTAMPDLFNIDGSQGIYSNPGARGRAWERPVSVEWINPPDEANPNGSSEFQVDAGVRIRGGYSRSTSNPKHAFHLYFRKEYGAGKLKYPLFGRDGAAEFNRIDLRTAQNYSWSFGGDARNTFLREEASRLAQLEMGQPGSRVRYVHLYLNGIYWGLFDLDERTEAAYSASYFGGEKEDYDTVKCEQDKGYTVGATDGSMDAWQELWNQSRAHEAAPTNDNYFRMMGLAADGVTPTADPVLLDVDNLIDYMLLTFWTGNLDGCTSSFLSNNRANNWFGTRRAVDNPRQGFRFFAHDFEHSFLNVNENRIGPWQPSNQANFSYSNPYYLHRDLIGNVEYRMRWADRVQQHMFHGGALSPEQWLDRFTRLAETVDKVIIAESARWGDASRSNPLTRADWINAKNSVLNMLVPRHNVVLSQLRAGGLYPTVDAPSILPFGGLQPSGVEVTMSAAAGDTIYYMPDGSDPRAVGGALRPGAKIFVSNTSTETFIPWSADGWRWYSENIDLGTAWRAPEYDDSAWAVGKAKLGYGVGNEATVMPRPNPTRYATAYFRKEFHVSHPEQISKLAMRLLYDDAYVVYLNGTRLVIDPNLPEDPPYDYFSGPWVNDAEVNFPDLPAALLVEGRNVLAVEIHQANATSSDLSMNLSLTAVRVNSSTPLVLTGTGQQILRARARNPQDSSWSALSEADFWLNTTLPQPDNLAISEIMYHPAGPDAAELAAGFVDGEDFEFLELLNLGSAAIDLRGAYIEDAVGFEFNDSLLGATLAPGARLLLVKNRAAFEFRHGTGLPVAGEYTGNLSNSGETITIRAGDGSILRQVTYSDRGEWPREADGEGFSLVLMDPEDPAADGDPARWRLSTMPGGNPGTSDAVLLADWLAARGLDDPMGDPDADGRVNLVEYALGSDPHVRDIGPCPSLSFDSFGDTEAVYPVVAHTRRAGADSVEVILETSDSLAGEWHPETDLVSLQRHPDGTQTLAYRSLPEPGQRFWRIRVVRRR